MAGVNDNLIPPKKGEVRNPKGRPKGVPNTKTRLERLLKIVQDKKNPFTGEVEGFSVAEQMDMAMILNAVKGDTKAYQALVDRLEGKPRQTIDQNVTVDPVKEILKGYGLDVGEDQASEGTTPKEQT